MFADGNPQARIMFVGEAPGRDEDIEGLPFVGRSGKLLDRMIAAIGLDRSKAYIANVIPWRPPGNRTPTPQETQICLPFIQRQIELVNPDVLVTLGNPSTQTLLSTREGIMRTRGKWFDYDTGTRTIRAMATFHPAYLLRSPSYKRMSWQDLRAIAKALEQRSPHPEEPRAPSLEGRHPGPGAVLRRLRPHDGPADAQQRLAAVHHPFEGARHFRHQARKALRDLGRRRARGVGGAPDHDAAGLVEFRDRHPRRSFRRGVEQQMRTPAAHRDETRQLRIAGYRTQPLIGSPFEIVAEEMRNRFRRQRGRHFGVPVHGRKSVVAITARAGAASAAAHTVRSTR